MMKNDIKKSWRGYVRISFLLLLLVSLISSISATQVSLNTTCPEPTVIKTGQTSNSVSFSWDAVSGATAYQVWYVRKENNASSAVMSTGNTTITISGLPPGTYNVYFATICGGGTSGWVITEDLVMM